MLEENLDDVIAPKHAFNLNREEMGITGDADGWHGNANRKRRAHLGGNGGTPQITFCRPAVSSMLISASIRPGIIPIKQTGRTCEGPASARSLLMREGSRAAKNSGERATITSHHRDGDQAQSCDQAVGHGFRDGDQRDGEIVVEGAGR